MEIEQPLKTMSAEIGGLKHSVQFLNDINNNKSFRLERAFHATVELNERVYKLEAQIVKHEELETNTALQISRIYDVLIEHTERIDKLDDIKKILNNYIHIIHPQQEEDENIKQTNKE